MDLHEEVPIAKLLFMGGLVRTIGAGQQAIARGNVCIERWNISVAESTLPRWVLRGVTITIGDRSMRISDDGARIIRQPGKTLV